MDRRRFLKTTLAAPAAFAIPEGYAALLDEKPKRVGIIGPGWYGKCDLIRLLQVAPVEVVSMCDVDKRMLEQAADRIQARQASKKRPRTYAD
ncbi:MAG: gfo/Idh/MocA family oxidoreductase, partial [Bryobacteraceae bacterium]